MIKPNKSNSISVGKMSVLELRDVCALISSEDINSVRNGRFSLTKEILTQAL